MMPNINISFLELLTNLGQQSNTDAQRQSARTIEHPALPYACLSTGHSRYTGEKLEQAGSNPGFTPRETIPTIFDILRKVLSSKVETVTIKVTSKLNLIARYKLLLRTRFGAVGESRQW